MPSIFQLAVCGDPGGLDMSDIDANSAVGYMSATSRAQMPVPVLRSKIRWGIRPMGSAHG
jgi:hypothetical protein